MAVRNWFVGISGLLISSIAVCTARAEPAGDLLQEVKAHFADWDLDHSGDLSLPEMDRAVASPAYHGNTAAAVVALRRAAKGAAGDVSALTLAKLEGLAKVAPTTRPTTQPDADVVNPAESDPDAAPPKGARKPSVVILYTSALKRINDSSHCPLFVGAGPTIEGIRQGRIGDCFCLAPLAAMTNRDPKNIVDRIADNGDGTYTVTLGAKPYIVPAPTDAELAMSNSVATTGIWVNVYEKAVGQSRLKAATQPSDASTPIATASRGGSAGAMLEALTGHPIVRFQCKTWRDADAATKVTLLNDLRKLIIETKAANRLIVGGTGAGVKVPGVTSNHAYAVLDFDAKRDVVTMWNPHSNTYTPKGTPGLDSGYLTKGGKFEVPLDQVCVWLAGFSFEQEPTVK